MGENYNPNPTLRRNYMTNQNQQPPETPRPSFGFELELPQLPGIPPEENPAVKVIEKTVEILNAATNGSDQELDEAVTRLHPRATRKLAEWLEFMHRNGAGVSLESGGQQAKISPEEMPRAAARLRSAAPKRTQPQPPTPLNRQGILNPRRETHQRANG